MITYCNALQIFRYNTKGDNYSFLTLIVVGERRPLPSEICAQVTNHWMDIVVTSWPHQKTTVFCDPIEFSVERIELSGNHQNTF